MIDDKDWNEYQCYIDLERQVTSKTTSLFVMLLNYYHDLSDKELKVSNTIFDIMWDDNAAIIEEVLVRELPSEYYVCREELRYADNKACFFEDENEVKQVIASLIGKGIFEVTEIEVSDRGQGCKMQRVLRFVRKNLFYQLAEIRERLEAYYEWRNLIIRNA